MVKHFFPLICLILLVCGTDSSSEEMVNNENACGSDFDSLVKFKMTLAEEKISEISFIDIVSAEKKMQNDSLKLELTYRGIPDSIEINNPNIPFGYSEYGMHLVFRNQMDTSNIDNIIVNLCYYRPEQFSEVQTVSFQEYLNECEKSIFHEYLGNGEKMEDIATGSIATNDEIDVKQVNNSIRISCSKQNLCYYIEDYLLEGFFIINSFNNSKTTDKNNFITQTLNADSFLRHFYIHNVGIRVVEN